MQFPAVGSVSPLTSRRLAPAFGKAAPFGITPTGQIAPTGKIAPTGTLTPTAGWGAGWGAGPQIGGWNPLDDGLLSAEEIARWSPWQQASGQQAIRQSLLPRRAFHSEMSEDFAVLPKNLADRFLKGGEQVGGSVAGQLD